MVPMKYRAIPVVLAVALLTTATVCKADDTGVPPTPNPAMMQIMQQSHARMEQLHSQARLSMLNALTPAHRNLLAQVVGQLAIAPNPDMAAAAKQLDANLSQGEARAILSISSSLEQQSRQIMESTRQQMMSAMPAGSSGHGPWMQRGDKMYVGTASEQWRTDPGMILLNTAARPGGMGEFHIMMGVPPPVH